MHEFFIWYLRVLGGASLIFTAFAALGNEDSGPAGMFLSVIISGLIVAASFVLR